MIDLKALAGKRYRVVVDPSYEHDGTKSCKLWHLLVPGKFGHIYVHGENTLGVFIETRYRINKLAEIPGFTLHQHGDQEATFVFAPELLDAAARAIKARKRRRYSEAQREIMIARLAEIRNAENLPEASYSRL